MVLHGGGGVSKSSWRREILIISEIVCGETLSRDDFVGGTVYWNMTDLVNTKNQDLSTPLFLYLIHLFPNS